MKQKIKFKDIEKSRTEDKWSPWRTLTVFEKLHQSMSTKLSSI